jgi:conjugative relaxase-like TrwC/TraI family protein
MTLQKISAGNGYSYLTQQTAANDVPVERGGLSGYYAEHGEAPGMWVGGGLAGLGIEPGAVVTEAQMTALFADGHHPNGQMTLGLPFAQPSNASRLSEALTEHLRRRNESLGRPACAPVSTKERAEARTAVATELFIADHGRAPANAEELSSFISLVSRRGRPAVAGYDLTFSPVKSVSVLWALADPQTAALIEAAHRAAVGDTMGWLEKNVAFTRLGRNGIRQVDTRGLIAAMFLHRDSRAGDPDLHTHVAVSNKVQTLDGEWRALDGRVLHRAIVAASERYNTRLEAHLVAWLNVRFAERPDTEPGKRPVRELVGIDPRLITHWSSRRRQITQSAAVLAADFQREHGRAPTPFEAIELAQRATLATRGAKHAPRSEADQRARWHAEAGRVIGPGAVGQMLSDATRHERRIGPPVDASALALGVVRTVSEHRATWQEFHLRAEAERQARAFGVDLAVLDSVVESVVAAAIGAHSIAVGNPDPVEVPADLKRRDGVSMYRVAATDHYTSSAILAAERQLLDAAALTDGRTVARSCIDLSLLEAAANGLPVNDGQAALVGSLTTSGARLQLALAPAGTGKTTALRVLASAWREGGGTVVGLAPSAAAAAVLREAIGSDETAVDTVAKLVHHLDHGTPPAWMGRIGDTTLVIIDEAGMASTLDLARTVEFAVAAGASVRLIGDDRQLASVAAGGVLRDLASTASAARLYAPVRFADAAEAAATVALRDGDPTALAFYLDRGRINLAAQAVDHAFAAWSADRHAGRDSLLLAGTRDTVRQLNERARAERLSREGREGRELPLADGTVAGRGDVIITRRNDRRLRVGATDWIKNGDRATVIAVEDGGAVTIKHDGTGRTVTLPAAYAASHVALGYATTIHGAQGKTADTCHVVLTGSETREQLYVAASRGRLANHLHLDAPAADSELAALDPRNVDPATALERLHDILANDAPQVSASTRLRAAADPAGQLHEAVDRYRDALARVPSAPSADAGPLPWLGAPPPGTDPAWRAYLAARADQIEGLANTVADRAIRDARGSALAIVDPHLLGELAIWRATHPAGGQPERLSDREARHEADLMGRLRQLKDAAGDGRLARWHQLLTRIDARITEDRSWPHLAEALDRAGPVGLRGDELVHLLTASPLPDSAPAAAAVYRIVSAYPSAAPDYVQDWHGHSTVSFQPYDSMDRGIDL